MGATGWSYFVPYEADASAALKRLREDVFARGDYVFGDGLSEEQVEEGMTRMRPELEAAAKEMAAKAEDPSQPEHVRAALKEFATRMREMGNYKARPRPSQPKTIEALLEQQAENGTHSILDVIEISPEPKFGAITPFPRAQLVEFFGTEKPSHEQIEEAYESGSIEEIASERWQGICITAFRNDSPSEIFFAGCSGD